MLSHRPQAGRPRRRSSRILSISWSHERCAARASREFGPPLAGGAVAALGRGRTPEYVRWMEDSPPTTPAPAGAAAEEEQPRREHRRIHVPTSVLVTVVVAALSVWVAPAFTRQWEDRKQARELQASLAEEIALATATTAGRVEAARVAFGKEQSQEVRQSIQSQWIVAHSRIEAKLRVYFSSELREIWSNFDTAVDRAIEAVYFARKRNEPLIGHLRPLPLSVSDLDSVEKFGRELGSVGNQNLRRARSGFELPRSRDNHPGRELGVYWLMRGVQDLADAFIERLMAADPEAFSTTRGDLLRDLLP